MICIFVILLTGWCGMRMRPARLVSYANLCTTNDVEGVFWNSDRLSRTLKAFYFFGMYFECVRLCKFMRNDVGWIYFQTKSQNPMMKHSPSSLRLKNVMNSKCNKPLSSDRVL